MGSALSGLSRRRSRSTEPNISGSTASNIPPALTEDAKLNDSLWKLYSPDDNPEMDILFFHGLQLDDLENAFWKTWLARGNRKDTQEMWPAWIAQNFPRARILFVSYNCIARRKKFGRSAIGMDLVRDIIEDTKIHVGQNAPVFLVGHCLGGIVIKQFILSAQVKNSSYDPVKDKKKIGKIDNFIRNLKGVIYYGVPHFGGSRIGELASQIQSKSPVLDLLKNLAEQTPWIKDEFEADCEEINNAITSSALAEGKPVIYKKFTGVVINEALSRSSVEITRSLEQLDHIEVCRAKYLGDEVSQALFEMMRQAGNYT